MGLALERSRSRSSTAPDYGTDQLVDRVKNWLVAYRLPDDGYGIDLHDVEEELKARL